MSAAEEIVAALGLAGAEVVTYEEWQNLPRHRRHSLSPVGHADGVFLRLPDPAPVAALRQILAAVENDDQPPGPHVRRIAATALVEFDEASS